MSAVLELSPRKSVTRKSALRFVGLDLETTGLNQAEGDRIVEIAMIEMLYLPASQKAAIRSSFVQRVNPERPIAPEAEAVHKISWLDVRDEPIWTDVAQRAFDFMTGADLLVMHNSDFDGPFIAGELLRVGITPPNVNTFCTMRSARWATATGKLPKLQELCFSLGVDYDPTQAHAAEYDVRCTLQCLVRGLKKGFYSLPEG